MKTIKNNSMSLRVQSNRPITKILAIQTELNLYLKLQQATEVFRYGRHTRI